MTKKYKYSLSYITGNIAPFRIDLLDALALSTRKVILYYFQEIDANINPDYVKRRPVNVEYMNLSTRSFWGQYNEITKQEIVIFDGYSGNAKIKLMLAMIARNKEYFISIDGIIKKTSNNFLVNKLKKVLLGNAVAIFSTNKRTDDIILSITKNATIRRHRFTTLRNVDIGSIKNIDVKSVKDKYGIPKNIKVVLFVGKFIKSKGIFELLNTIEKDKFYVFIGGDIDKLDIHKEAFLSNTLFIRFLEKDEILMMMKASDVFVLPTYTDVWGLVVVEALCCGLPVVTTTMCNAGLEFLTYGLNGFIIEPQDENALIEAVNSALLLEPIAVELFNKNLMKDYTLEKSAEDMLESIRWIRGVD